LENRIMPKLINSYPKYRHHKRSGQAIVELNGLEYRLGPWNTEASSREYRRLVEERLARDQQPIVDAADLTVAELIVRHWAFAKKKYVRNGKPTPEQFHVKTALRPLKGLYANQWANEFTP
jgi:hypothetical protein